MTIENLATIENVREYHFDPKEVIKGLNGYYGSDKCNSYITVRRNDVEGPAYLSTPIYFSSLIEWLRVDYDIFYRPGLILDQVEDEISKRGLWCDKDADIPELVDTLFKAYDECKERADKNRKDAVKLSEEIKNLNAELATKWTKTSLINWLQQRARNKGVELDDSFLYSDDTQYDWTDIVDFLFDEIVKMRVEIKAKESGIEDLKEHITLLEADLKKAKMEKEKFLIEVADREEEIESLQNKDYDVYLEHRQYIIKSIMCNIRQEASRNGFALPEKVDGEPLSIERTFHDLLELLMKRTAEIEESRKKHWNDLRDIHKALGRDGTCDSIDGFAKAVKARAEYVESLSRNAEQKTRKAVNEQLKKDTDYVADTLRDILEALGISKSDTMRFDVFGLKTKALQRASVIKSEHERYREQLGKATADYKALSEENQKLKASQKSDVNKLIRDCCTKHGVIAPSRYFSDEACIEYLFSLIEQKDRSFAILQNLYRDIFKKQPDGLSAEDIANNILDKVLETEALLHLESVDNYKLSLKDYILHDIKKRGYRYNGLETKSIEEIVDWIIAMATCPNKILEEAKKEAKKETKQECYWYLWNALKKLSPECDALKIDHYENLVDRIFYEMSLVMENCKQCQRKHSTEKLGYILRTNKAEEELKKLRSANEANNDVIKKLKELLNEINKEEDGEWFKP